MSCETPEEGRTSKAGGAEGGASADALIAPPPLPSPSVGGRGLEGDHDLLLPGRCPSGHAAAVTFFLRDFLPKLSQNVHS